MAIKIGDIDLANEVVELHYQHRRTLLILQTLIDNNPGLAKALTAEKIKEIDAQALKFVSDKFPNMGITKRD